MIRELHVTPATPRPLLPGAATVPATCVPCPLSSAGCCRRSRSPSRASRRRSRCRRRRRRSSGTRAVLAGVDPDVRREVGMGRVDAGVDDGDDDVGAAGGDRPRLGSVDVGVRRSRRPVHGLAGVVQAPEPREERIVRDDVGRVEDEVRLGVRDAWISVQRLDRLRRGSRCDRDERAVNRGEPLDRLRVGVGQDVGLRRRRHTSVEADEDRSRLGPPT